MKTSDLQKHNISKIERCIKLLTEITGKIILWGSCVLLHGHILVIICAKLGIDLRSYPDTLEYRLLFAYLVLTQCGFIVWFCQCFDKFLSYLVKPINLQYKNLEIKLEEKLGNNQTEGK